MPFANSFSRAIHFAKHGHKFGAATEFDYERMADAFMALPLASNLYECINPTGTNDRVRLDSITLHFGVAYLDTASGTVLRMFHVRTASSIAAKGGPQGFVNHKCAEVHP